jgi:23S rRNA-/tRNA-specific pseudouridylate synthase
VHSSQNPEKGQLVVTHYEVLNSARNTLLKLRLETGKKIKFASIAKRMAVQLLGIKNMATEKVLLKGFACMPIC